MKSNIFTPILLGLILSLAGAVSSQTMAHHQKAVFDFDGDKISDPVMIENVNSNLTWHILESNNGMVTVQFGLAEMNDIAVPADYDGDGTTDVAIWRPGNDLWRGPANFWILSSRDGSVSVVQWGLKGDNPRVTQDFDGDGQADPAIVRHSGGALEWWAVLSNGGIMATSYGRDTDYFIRGDFDGDDHADLAVYRTVADKTTPASTFIITYSSDSSTAYVQFGLPGDIVVPGDFDGDGRDDIAVFRNNPAKTPEAMWYWINSKDDSVGMMPFGLNLVAPDIMDCPAPGDYDKDGAADLALWRMLPKSPDSEFHMLLGSGGKVEYKALVFGKNEMDVPNFTMQIVDTKYAQ